MKPVSKLVRRFRSSTSGLWYEKPESAGTINAVELNGKILERHSGEGTLQWIKRVSEWASNIHELESKEAKP